MPATTFRPIDLDAPPAEVAAAWADRDGFVFLDSAVADAGSVSIIGVVPDLVLEGDAGDWGVLAAELARRERVTTDSGLPEGAAIGWFAYDGRFRFGFYENVLVYSHATHAWYQRGEWDFDAESDRLPGNDPVAGPGLGGELMGPFRADLTADDYCRMVRAAQEYIRAGDIYQVCLAHRFVAQAHGDLWEVYEALRHYSPAPHAAFLRLGGTAVLSASPESFLRLSGRRITTRPIKGTRPRRAEPDQDERSACDLVTSPKEIAELVMITDLERNDLGRVCEYGSVRVTDLLRLERFEQVFHLVSTIEGVLRPEVSHLDAVAACFPGGSISGAPKKRAREIIAELETTPRGIYTGALGYLGFNGESQLNIAIRTVVAEAGRATFHVGAGIVADSVPEREWQETLDKAAGILLLAEAGRTDGNAATGLPHRSFRAKPKCQLL